MPKAKIAYLCTECGAHSLKWAGQCPDCSAWNTLTETTYAAPKATASAKTKTLDELPGDIEYRHATGFGEFDRVLGGGLVLFLVGRVGWSAAMVVMALLMALPLLPVWRYREPIRGASSRTEPAGLGTLGRFFRRPGAWGSPLASAMGTTSRRCAPCSLMSSRQNRVFSPIPNTAQA